MVRAPVLAQCSDEWASVKIILIAADQLIIRNVHNSAVGHE
jgi:hypothetical protein